MYPGQTQHFAKSDGEGIKDAQTITRGKLFWFLILNLFVTDVLFTWSYHCLGKFYCVSTHRVKRHAWATDRCKLKSSSSFYKLVQNWNHLLGQILMSYWTDTLHQLYSVVISGYKNKKKTSCSNSGIGWGRKVGNSAECLIVVRASILFRFSSVENIFEGTCNTFCKKSQHINIFLKYRILM